MNEIINEWLSEFCSSDTITCYKYDIKKFQDYMRTNALTMDSITLRDLRKWRQTMNSTPGDRRRISAIKSFFKFAYRLDYLSKNISKILKVPRKTQIKHERIFTEDQCISILNHASGDTKLFLQVLYYLGLRISEARMLTRQHITERNNCLVFSVIGKGKKLRNVEMGPKNSLLLKSILFSRDGFIFPGRAGPISRSGMIKRVNKVIKKVNRHASCHFFRHSFATHSLKRGATLVNVSKAMGHNSLSTTSLYLHSSGNGPSSYLE